MPSTDQARTAERIRLTLDLFESGEAMMRARLRREHPDEDADKIEARLRAWLLTRPGAEDGDGVGRPRPKPSEAE